MGQLWPIISRRVCCVCVCCVCACVCMCVCVHVCVWGGVLMRVWCVCARVCMKCRLRVHVPVEHGHVLNSKISICKI